MTLGVRLHVKRRQIGFIGDPQMMRIASNYAGTDTISSIALVACCILSSLILISSLSYSFGERTALQLQTIREEGTFLFQEFVGLLTEIGKEGIRYLRNDWIRIADAFGPGDNFSLRVSCYATIRILNQPEYVILISCNSMRCSLTERFAVPALFLTGHSSLPAEISMVVGI